VSSPKASAADSLKAANELRRQGRWAEAENAYSEIARGYPGSSQGSVAALAAASLRLEHLNDARGALALYQASLRTAGLSAEAELGIANCYRALGERDKEIAALKRLVSAYPKALFRKRVQSRLKALQGN
jgi:tetratricopeptide (TPR) repeat protein